MTSIDLGTILLGLAAVFTVIPSLESGNDVIDPIGPKMCLRACDHRVGCSSYMYLPSQLSCHLDPDSVKEIWGKRMCRFSAFKDKETVEAEKNMRCPLGAKLFHSKIHDLQCKLRWQKRKGQGKITGGRILLLPSSQKTDPSHDALQLFRHENKVLSYPYLRVNALAAVYVSISKKLLISTVNPTELFWTALNAFNKTLIWKECRVTCLAVDENKRVVFLISDVSPKGILSMTIEEKRHPLPLSLDKDQCSPYSIAVDTKRYVMYVSCTNGMLLRYRYKTIFKFQSRVTKTAQATMLIMNLKKDVLYYMNATSWSISELVFPNYVKRDVTNVGSDATFVFVANEFYISPTPYEGRFIKFNQGKKSEIIHHSKERKFVMCVVP